MLSGTQIKKCPSPTFDARDIQFPKVDLGPNVVLKDMTLFENVPAIDNVDHLSHNYSIASEYV